MENSVIKSSKMVCSLALILWSTCATVFVLRIMRYIGLVTFNVYMGIDIAPIAWYPDDPEAQIMQWIELFGYVLTTTLVLAMTIHLLLATRKGIKANRVFTRRNARVLKWLAGATFLNTLFTDNIGIIYGSRQIYLGSSPFVCALIVLIVATLYQMAVSVAEENELTI